VIQMIRRRPNIQAFTEAVNQLGRVGRGRGGTDVRPTLTLAHDSLPAVGQ